MVASMRAVRNFRALSLSKNTSQRLHSSWRCISPILSQQIRALSSKPEPNSVSEVLRQVDDVESGLRSTVYIPRDPNGVLTEDHPAASILANSSIVIQRQLELMNIMM